MFFLKQKNEKLEGGRERERERERKENKRGASMATRYHIVSQYDWLPKTVKTSHFFLFFDPYTILLKSNPKFGIKEKHSFPIWHAKKWIGFLSDDHFSGFSIEAPIQFQLFEIDNWEKFFLFFYFTILQNSRKRFI